MLLMMTVLTTVVCLAVADDAPAPASPQEPAVKPSDDAPSAASPAQQTRAFKPRPLPPEYHVLLKRNLFFSGSKQSQTAGRQQRGAATPEDAFVLRGIMHQSGQYTALIEDLATREIRSLVIGDSVARGTLRHVSFNGLEYLAEGRRTRVSIGEKLTGVEAPPAAVAVKASKPVEAKPSEEKRRDRDREKGKGEEDARYRNATSSGVETGG